MDKLKWKLNTSNVGKFTEFKRLFSQYGVELETTDVDLKEIEADPLTVITHKASQLQDHVIVEDTSLEVEGAKAGIHIRWLLDHLGEYEGRKAEWIVYLAYQEEESVYIYEGKISGQIVRARGNTGFGFDPVFLPDEAKQTLAEAKPDLFNARAKAVEALMQGQVFTIQPVIKSWEGPWQN